MSIHKQEGGLHFQYLNSPSLLEGVERFGQEDGHPFNLCLQAWLVLKNKH